MSNANLWTSVTAAPFLYLLYRPDNVLARPSARWPLIVFLHGAGHRGANLRSLYTHGLVATLPDLIPLPCFVVAPQCPADTTWGYQLERLDHFLDHLLVAHPIDAQRISLTGSSMGANGVWCWAKHAPQRFAALAPIAGGRSWILDEQPEQLDRLRDTPIWVFHGEHDRSVALHEPMQLIKRVRDSSGNVRITIYPGAEHTVWPLAYRDRELFDWLLQQHRSGDAA